MEINKVLRKDEMVIRILKEEKGRCLCINCDCRNMPKWFMNEDLQHYEETVAPSVEGDITAKQRKIAHERFTLIAPMLSFLTDDEGRNRMMNRISKEKGISKQTLRRYLCRYLVYQDIRAIAPVGSATKKELSRDQKNMRWALNKFFYTTKKSTLTDAYIHLLKEKYSDAEGHLLPDFPSLRQFRYFEHKHRKIENYLISRNGIKNYQRNNRPLLGEGVQEFAPYIGMGMLDATVCDIYLINRKGQVVGRPILVAGVDANTSLCLGYALLWEGGVYSLQQLMLNIVSDKEELCRSMGIMIDERQWPVSELPGVMVTDMGAEYVGATFEQIAELGVTLINLPAYRPDLKGPVEKLFDLIQDSYRDVLKGKGVIMPDFLERGAHDYRKDACLTMEEFERIVVRCIVYYNSERIISDYPYTNEMIQQQVRPYACDIWKNKSSEPGTNLIAVTKKEIILTLLPRTVGRFTRSGLEVQKLRYHKEGYKEAYLRGGKCNVAYNPDDVGSVWLIDNGEYEEFTLIGTRFSGKTLEDVQSERKAHKIIVKREDKSALEAKIRLLRHTEAIAQNVPRPKEAGIKEIRDNRKTETRKQHKDIGRLLRNE